MNDLHKSDIVLFYTTFESKQQAVPIIRDLLKNHLIICANFFQIDSIYRWKGEIEEGQEVVCFLKTTLTKSDDLKEFLLKYHPYEIPCLINMHVENLSSAYMKWALEETKSFGDLDGK